MELIYALQEIPDAPDCIFLAGPTPRSPEVPSWRPEAIKMLKDQGFEGTVLIPEPPPGKPWDWDKQVAWEDAALEAAACILFWIPRDLGTMPGFTTNVEFGMWCDSGKIVLGAPEDAPKMRYLRWHANKLGIPSHTNLQDTIQDAIEMALDYDGFEPPDDDEQPNNWDEDEDEDEFNEVD